jgi:hypothetical protein
MMIWTTQIYGLCATGILAVMGIGMIIGGFADDRHWLTRIGWLLIGGLFMLPFIAVLTFVLISRLG